MTRNERFAWKRFLEECQRQQQTILDGCVPVALIALPVKHNEPQDDGLVVDFNGEPRIIWPNGVQEEDKKMLMAHIAGMYLDDKVKRIQL